MDRITTEHGVFLSNNETGQTAEEVYQEWLANKDKPQPITEITITTNKESIIADGIDIATITAEFPEGVTECYVMLNSPPATKELVVDGKVIIEIASQSAGYLLTEFATQDERKHIIIEAKEVVV